MEFDAELTVAVVPAANAAPARTEMHTSAEIATRAALLERHLAVCGHGCLDVAESWVGVI
jgi:hypothetical protein